MWLCFRGDAAAHGECSSADSVGGWEVRRFSSGGDSPCGCGCCKRRRLDDGLDLLPLCMEGARGIDFRTNANIDVVEALAEPTACRWQCGQRPLCVAWTWTADHMCFLKGEAAMAQVARLPLAGAVSGSRGGAPLCTAEEQVQLDRFRWRRREAMADDAASAQSRGAGGAVSSESLFCMALMASGTHEQELIAMQQRTRRGIFDCDGYVVYSDHPVHISSGYEAMAVSASFGGEAGDDLGARASIHVWTRVWDQVHADGDYLRFAWTVKAEPDCVFMPRRLRPVLAGYAGSLGDPRGVYLNNCEFGLQGAIEVFSAHAVTQWLHSRRECEDHFGRLCRGDCHLSEATLVDQCLRQVVRAKRETVERLLADDACGPRAGWRDCTAAGVVAFHPFAEVAAYSACWNIVEVVGSEA